MRGFQSEAVRAKAMVASVASRQAARDCQVARLGPLIDHYRRQQGESYRTIAELLALSHETVRGDRTWSHVTVKRLHERYLGESWS